MAKYYNPQGKKRGGFTKLQTGGQASIEALRRQEEPQLRALRQQQQRQSEYDTDLVRGEDRKFNAEFWNRTELKKMEDDIWRQREKAERVRAEGEISALKGKATEFGKQAKFWEKFSTTYSKEWGKLAEGIATKIDVDTARKDFNAIQSMPEIQNMFKLDEAKYSKAERDALSEIAKLALVPNLSDDQKYYLQQNFKILGNTGWTLQNQLVGYEEQNVSVRFAQLQQLLDSQGIQMNQENVRSIAKNLAFMVSTRAGITNPGLQNKLVVAYTKEANARYKKFFNTGYAKKSSTLTNEAVQTFAKAPTQENYVKMMLNAMSMRDTEGHLLHQNPRSAFIEVFSMVADTDEFAGEKAYELLDFNTLVFIDGDPSKGIDEAKTYGTRLGDSGMYDKKNFRKPLTWRDRYKGGGLLALMDDMEGKITEVNKAIVTRDNANNGANDIRLRNEITAGDNAFHDARKKGITDQEYFEQYGIQPIDLKNEVTLTTYKQKLGNGQFPKASKVFHTLTGISGDTNISRALFDSSIFSAIERGDYSWAEWAVTESGLFGKGGTAENTKYRGGMYTQVGGKALEAWQALVAAGLNDIPEAENRAANAIAMYTPGRKLGNEVEDGTIKTAKRLLVQAERHYFLHDPQLQTIENARERLAAATKLAQADLHQNQGLFFRLEPGNQGGAEVTRILFPALSSVPGLYRAEGYDYYTTEAFQNQILNKTGLFADQKEVNLANQPGPKWMQRDYISRWLKQDYLPNVARRIIEGDADSVTYTDRIRAISKATGIPERGVVNILLESMEYTERLPLDLSSVLNISLNEIKEAEFPEQETGMQAASTDIEVPGASKDIKKVGDYYASPASDVTRLRWYAIVRYMQNRGQGTTPTNPTNNGGLEPTSEGIGPENLDPTLVRDEEMLTNNLYPQDKVRDLIGDRKSITGHQI